MIIQHHPKSSNINQHRHPVIHPFCAILFYSLGSSLRHCKAARVTAVSGRSQAPALAKGQNLEGKSLKTGNWNDKLSCKFNRPCYLFFWILLMDKTLQDTTLDSGPVYRIQTLSKNIRFAKPFRCFFSTANVVHSSVPSDPFWLHLCCFPRDSRKSSCNLKVSTHHESFFTRWGKIWLGWPPSHTPCRSILEISSKKKTCYFFSCYNML